MYKTLWDGLLSHFGLGKIHVIYACAKLGVKDSILLNDLSGRQIRGLDKILRMNKFRVGRLLERDIYLRTSALRDSNAYRAIRARQGLPNRGQRTHTNAKTAKRLSGLWDKNTYAKRMRKKEAKQKKFIIKNAYLAPEPQRIIIKK